MNFNSTDYLTDLNFDFEVSPTLTDNAAPGDLDIFAQADFYDLDVFSKNAPLEQKNVVVKQERYELGLDQTHTQIDLNATPSHVDQLAHISPADQYISLSNSSPVAPLIPLTPSLTSNLTRDDKRKRNTAALARFRIKKKKKEQEMEFKARELQEHVNNLERKLKTLEMENKCLKNLILQQNERKNNDLLEDIKKRSSNNEQQAFQFTI